MAKIVENEPLLLCLPTVGRFAYGTEVLVQCRICRSSIRLRHRLFEMAPSFPLELGRQIRAEKGAAIVFEVLRFPYFFECFLKEIDIIDGDE